MNRARLRSLIRRWWWAAANVIVVTVAVTVVVDKVTPETYTSSGSFTVKTEVSDRSDLVRAAATLKSSDEIVATYAEIATSDLLDAKARAILDLPVNDEAHTEVTSSVVPGTNVLLIGARSEDPQLAIDMATAVGLATEEHIRLQNDVFSLVVVDPPSSVEEDTSRYNTRIAGGILIGAMIGLALAAAADRRFPERQSTGGLRITTDHRSLAYNRRYLELRLGQEQSRSAASGHPFCIGTLQLLKRRRGDIEDDRVASFTTTDLRTVTKAVAPTLRPHDVFAHIGKGRFMAIFPGYTKAEADTTVQEWRRLATDSLLARDISRDIRVSVGVCEYQSSLFDGDEEAELIASTL